MNPAQSTPTSSATTSSSTTSSTNATTIIAASSESTCGFEGNSDIYGLGIRVGIYLQWLAAIAAEMASPADVDAAQAAEASYQLAMFSGLILVTQDLTIGVFAVEAFLVLLFCFAGVWVGSVPAAARTSGLSSGWWRRWWWSSSSSGGHEEDPPGGGGRWSGSGGALTGPITTTRTTTTTTTTTTTSSSSSSGAGLFRQLLGCVACAYGTWTLFARLRLLPRTACDEVAFFFAPVRLFGWFHDMFKAFFVISLAASTLLLAAELVRRGAALAAVLRNWPPAMIELSSPAPGNNHDDPAAAAAAADPGAGKTTVLLRHALGRVAAWALFIVAVELTLWWNAVRGVYECRTFGQLFPLVLSASNLVGVCRRVAKAVLARKVSFKL
ncbi:hypothetical protein MYCTH_2297171 [Thermothelomyces thermophilus ATCC 42464]|uniref:Uncharacterized protein n=1 Tax=Thermothelomyces thermophilus (strain ATCC 42464 / BCRC 31852 / DSM 1799) TaxID=573729 RepID=G2Q4N2_THET4|nr:uncharacterized protein MYCTH_2297171 [Thermothelomyces thermophilus ATCC 42464]AEO54521.1 hypothetical protein MYCTH_2297171 [Thermothelomyces thermophilus ATCC 42464]